MHRPAAEQEARLLGEEERRSAELHGPGDRSPSPRHDTTCSTNRDTRDRPRTAGGPGLKASPRNVASDPDLPTEDDGDDDFELDSMDPLNPRRPGLGRLTEGRSGTPLLYKTDEDDRGRPGYDEEEPPPTPPGPTGRSRSRPSSAHSNGSAGFALPLNLPARPTFSRRSTMRSRSPREVAAEQSTKRKYTYAAFFLGLSLVSFCVQTELSAHIQHNLGWDKAYCMMYFTHGSWIVLWPVLLLCLRVQKWDQPWPTFWRGHVQLLRSTATMVETRLLDVSRASVHHRSRPVWYMVRFTSLITMALTIAGLSWYIAVSLTTPSDLTAIYNCSAFFAYVFSVPLLKEPLRLDKSVAVLIAIAGVLVVAYGDTKSDQGVPVEGHPDAGGGSRFLGNLVIGIGSVLYGLYEVLYKRFACPPEGVSPHRGMVFAMTFGACIGLFTLTVLWIPMPFLDWTGIEKFELPDASTGWLVLAAVLSNATFSGSFLVLISLTSPVLSSVAALLTIFIVAIADWFITGEPLSFAAIIGGVMIIVAFLGLSWSTYREMTEHEAQKLAVDFSDSDEDEDDDEDDTVSMRSEERR